MKKLIPCLIAACGLAAGAHAGDQTVTAQKDTKTLTPPAECSCFKDHEFQLDFFGDYNVGNGPTHMGIQRDHGWGGGAAINYFFTKNIGIGAEYTLSYGKESPDTDAGRDRGHHTYTHGVAGNVIYRLPINTSCLAPYVYLGGGTLIADHEWAEAHGGLGLEYRIIPAKVGIFADTRWTYLGDRFDRGDVNFFSARVGVRLVF